MRRDTMREEIKAHHQSLMILIAVFGALLITMQMRFARNTHEMKGLISELSKPRPVDVVYPRGKKRDEQMIHFVIAGFAKCGTTTLMQQLNTNETFMGKKDTERVKEIHLLRHPNLINEFKAIFKDHIGKRTPNNDKPIINGFKSPEVLMSEQFMMNMETYFPETDFIVSTRHPVLHFQSMYNFKFRSKKFSGERPNPLSLIGNCGHQCFDDCVPKVGENRGVCTRKSYFHYGLSRFMLTPMNTEEELDLLDHIDWSKHPGLRGNIFLLEIGQIGDMNMTRRGQLTNGLEDFLGLETNSVTIPPRNPNREKEHHFDVCEDRYQPVRDVLVEMGTKASKWIQEYLLKSPRVVVSNRDHFLELINKWQSDPCI